MKLRLKAFMTSDSTRMTWAALIATLVVTVLPGLAFEAMVEKSGFSLLIWIAYWIWVAARQHTLYVLNHEASHGLLFELSSSDDASKLTDPEERIRRIEKKNRRFAEVFCLWPFFHHPEAFSFVLWRRVHRLHHAHLFTDNDPNFVGRKLQGHTLHKLSGTDVFKSCCLAPFQAAFAFFFGSQDYVGPRETKSWRGRRIPHLKILLGLGEPFSSDPELRSEQRRKLIAFGVLIAVVYGMGAFDLLLWHWLVPLWTFYPMILRWNDLTEHNWWEASQDLNVNTNSLSDRWWRLLLVSDLGRHYHREHHVNPRVPWWRIRSVNAASNAR